MSGTRNAPPGNPLATNPAPPAPRLGLDADAMKVLRDMTPATPNNADNYR